MDKQVKVCVFDKSTTKDKVIETNGNAILDNICTSCKVHENLDGTHEIDADFLLDNDGLWENLEEEAILKVQVDYGNEYFRLTAPKKGTRKITEYGRQATIYESMHLWLSDVRPTSLNGAAAINWILDGAIGIKELEVYSNISNSNTAYYEDMNMYEALHDCDQSFQNRWGGEIQRRGYLLRILDRVGSDRGVQIRSRKNLTGFEASTNVDSITTRIKPKGYNGITIDGFVDSPLIGNYARVYTKTITYSDVKVKSDSEDTEGFDTLEEAQAELRRLAELEFSENHIDEISADYDINFVDLSKTEEYKDYIQAERVYIGDTVHVFEERLGINVDVRVIDRVYNVLTQKVESIKLSNKDISTKKKMDDVLIDIVKGVEQNDNSLEKYIQSFINAGIKDSYVFYNQSELIVCDSERIEDAIHVWRFNRNGLAHSANGYQGPYDIALTADGKINANMVLAGTIKGQYIDARNLTVGDTIAISAEGFLTLIQGLVSIDKEGIKINLIDSENNVLGYVLYDGQGVQIFTTEDELISNFTREGSYIDKVKIDDLVCNQVMKIANRSGCPTTWFIAAEATGDGSGRDEENKANSLADVLRRIRGYGLTFTEEMNIYIESGNINEEIIFQDLNGTVINFNFSKGVVINTDKFIFEDNNARIALKGETNGISCSNSSITADEINSRPMIKTSNSDGLFKVRNSNYISIRGFRLLGNGGNCVKNYNGSKVLIFDCDMKNFDYGAYTSDMAQSCISSCRGNLDYLAYIGNGGIFSSTINIPKCSQSDIVDRRQSGIWIKEDSYTQLDALQTETTTTEISTNTKESFDITDLYTVTEGSGKNVNGRKGYTGQGRFQNYKAHRGYIVLPSAEILAALAKKESYELKIKLTRLNTKHGYNSKTPHPIIRATGAGIETDYWDSATAFTRGETQVITLPDSIKNAIATGATRLELWASDNQEQQYSFYDNVSIIIEGANKQNSSGSGEGATTEETIADFPYADDLVEVAMTYYRVCDNEYTSGQAWSQGFTYRASNTPMSANCESAQDITNSLWVKVANKDGSSIRHYKAIDCSTGANMWLRGIPYASSPYASETLFNSFRSNRLQKNDGIAWSIAPVRADGKPARYAYELCNYFYRMNKGIVFLKDPDTNKILKGSIGTSEDDYSNIKKGDIIFYAKKDENDNWKRPGDDEFMHVSHVAICYGHSSTYNKKAVIESTNVTTKKHSFTDGTSYNAGMRIKQIETYADAIVMVVRLQESHYNSSSSGDTGTATETQEYTNCVNTTGVIDGNNYIYKLKNCKVTAYGGDGSSACNIPLNLFKTCGSFNVPYGTKIYIPSLNGKNITDGNGKTVTSDGIFTVNDTGVGCTDFDIYCSTKSDANAESVFGNSLREDVYVLEWGTGYGTAWSYTQSYAWAYNNGTLSAYKSAFKDYIKYDGTLINLLKFKNNDADIRNSTYWNILNS